MGVVAVFVPSASGCVKCGINVAGAATGCAAGSTGDDYELQ